MMLRLRIPALIPASRQPIHLLLRRWTATTRRMLLLLLLLLRHTQKSLRRQQQVCTLRLQVRHWWRIFTARHTACKCTLWYSSSVLPLLMTAVYSITCWVHAGHTPGTHCRLTLDLITLHTPLKNTSKHTCSDSLNLKPPAPPYPLQDF